MLSDRQLFSMFNVELQKRSKQHKRGLQSPCMVPLWKVFVPKDGSQFTGKAPVIDKAPHLPGTPGSQERMDYLTAKYAEQEIGRDANNQPIYSPEVESPF